MKTTSYLSQNSLVGGDEKDRKDACRLFMDR
jgi:hypothetical protein